jgi:uncharacterized Zn-binding protein involved in type VI secretion
VHAWSGQCNKNLGNAFVIVWRIGDEHTLSATQKHSRIRGGSNDVAAQGSNVGGTGNMTMSTKSIRKVSVFMYHGWVWGDAQFP